MKEIKAFIKAIKVDQVVHELENAGVCDMTVSDVMAVGSIIDAEHAKFSGKLMEKFSSFAKLELVCTDDNVHKTVEILRRTAYTGYQGDGIIYVTPVEMAIKIRTGAVGEEGL